MAVLSQKQSRVALSQDVGKVRTADFEADSAAQGLPLTFRQLCAEKQTSAPKCGNGRS
jgi:hypothetical protein